MTRFYTPRQDNTTDVLIIEMTMNSRPSHTFCRFAGAFFISICVFAGDARADLYTYKNTDGSIVVTSSPRKGLKLIEHIRDSSGSAKSGKKRVSAKHQRSRQLAEQRRDRSQNRSPRAPVANRENMYDDFIREASKKYQIPFAFIKGVIKVESNFTPTVISPVGAMGLMQLMPATADYLGVKDAFDPRQNIIGGAKLLRTLTNRYNGDINLLLSAYNAGEGAVDRHDGIPYDKTREYVRRVYHFYKTYQAQDQGTSSTALELDNDVAP